MSTKSKRPPIRGPSLYTAIFAALTGRALTTFRAGFALNIISCTVERVRHPCRALVAGLLDDDELGKARDDEHAVLLQLFVADFGQRLHHALDVLLRQFTELRNLFNQLRLRHLGLHLRLLLVIREFGRYFRNRWQNSSPGGFTQLCRQVARHELRQRFLLGLGELQPELAAPPQHVVGGAAPIRASSDSAPRRR